MSGLLIPGAVAAPMSSSLRAAEPRTSKRVSARRWLLAFGVAVLGGAATASVPVAQAADACPNAAIRQQQNATEMAGCRAYEMVSPVANNSANVFPSAGSVQAAASGDAIKFETQTAMVGSSAAPFVSAYIAARDATGWTTRALNPAVPVDPYATGEPDRYIAFSEDLSRGVLRTVAPLTGGAREGQSNLFLQDTLGAGKALLTPPALDAFPLDGLVYQSTFSGPSPAAAKTFFESAKQLTPDAVPGASNLYQHDAATGELSVAGVLPGNLGVASGGAAAGTGSAASNVTGQRAVTADGSRVFFTTPGDSYNVAKGDIYLRIDGATTVPVSRSGLSNDPNGPLPAQFAYASADGARAIFTSPEKLTADATTGPTSEGNDLYLWRQGGSPELIDLTPDTNPSDANGATVLGVLGTSEDLSYVYFAAQGDLAAGATSGASNVYLWHDGVTTYVGDGALAANWDLSPGYPGGGGGQGTRAARVTPDGKHLLFASNEQLTSFDSAGSAQLYLFDADEPDGVVCVSCDPRGSKPSGSASFVTPVVGSGTFGVGSLVRPMTADGSRVFFNSPDRLVSRDANSRQDVYEWRDGQLSLISSGTSDGNSYFADASASGDDVFFTTNEHLVGQDRDNNRTLYVARVNGGIASQSPAGPPPPCAGDACRPPLVPSGAPASAATVTFEGAGNDQASGRRSATTGRVTLSKSGVRGRKITLVVGVPAAGRIVLSGASIQRAERRVTSAVKVRVSVSLTKKFRSALTRGHRSRKVAVKVTYRPTSGKSSTATVNLTIKA